MPTSYLCPPVEPTAPDLVTRGLWLELAEKRDKGEQTGRGGSCGRVEPTHRREGQDEKLRSEKPRFLKQAPCNCRKGRESCRLLGALLGFVDTGYIPKINLGL